MSIPAWPVTLPENLLVVGYSETTPDVALRSTMDAGPDKVRRRFTAGVRPVKGGMNLTLSQLGDLKEFYNDDLLGGSLRFSWVDPYDGTTAVEMRFTEAPTWSANDPDLFAVSLNLEIMP